MNTKQIRLTTTASTTVNTNTTTRKNTTSKSLIKDVKKKGKVKHFTVVILLLFYRLKIYSHDTEYTEKCGYVNHGLKLSDTYRESTQPLM
jgi:hypothetical protein